jgi:hypothetical protein
MKFLHSSLDPGLINTFDQFTALPQNRRAVCVIFHVNILSYLERCL